MMIADDHAAVQRLHCSSHPEGRGGGGKSLRSALVPLTAREKGAQLHQDADDAQSRELLVYRSKARGLPAERRALCDNLLDK